mmetsp:Transcript_2296/g.5374  ORF Transcript_2296/g.5374 Transcript_2296/m.5374 type:complete len:239 (+) Transcript_2296:276-992(+)|eukprot:CAMPEP_0114555790 /NCGR_PEP_ID=MMETSP0114-20121206/8940_1 /TAXON_ID=31324 /ORGANISM="Goniomonas sp, Strain m" /LENGTH=238 /DNA_ID=CAMNT_0001740945 /DNA_START=266 /DNA_END=982 /DNA_ORIENTATION=-
MPCLCVAIDSDAAAHSNFGTPLRPQGLTQDIKFEAVELADTRADFDTLSTRAARSGVPLNLKQNPGWYESAKHEPDAPSVFWHESCKANTRPSRLYIFDLDGTLVNLRHIFSPETKSSLEQLKAQGVRLAVASFRQQVMDILIHNHILSVFDVVVSQRCPFPSKQECVDAVLAAYDPTWTDVIPFGPEVSFFDDCIDNLDEVIAAHPEIRCLHVKSPIALLEMLRKPFERPERSPLRE